MANAYCGICSKNKEIDLNPGDVISKMDCSHYYNLVTGTCYGSGFDLCSELEKTIWHLINSSRKNRTNLLNAIDKMDIGPTVSLVTH